MPDRKLEVRVQPRSGKNEVAGERNGRLIVKVTAPPEDGKANAAACALIAKWAGVPKSKVSVIRGAANRDKVVEIRDVD